MNVVITKHGMYLKFGHVNPYLMKARSTSSRSAASCAKELKVVFASPRMRDSVTGLGRIATGSVGDDFGERRDSDGLHGERPRAVDAAEA